MKESPNTFMNAAHHSNKVFREMKKPGDNSIKNASLQVERLHLSSSTDLQIIHVCQLSLIYMEVSIRTKAPHFCLLQSSNFDFPLACSNGFYGENGGVRNPDLVENVEAQLLIKANFASAI